ncbi:PA2778 family cysteine peptidase [Oceanospirillum linum]|uniref:Peptidase C39-like domain-containing protein n=1 Tax=Oceanospirillum linum TaxID=966 RepID=A0A1T1HC73_OCELI|nr:PA2778 family cysteine peptidase [Oceanospirillum linum]OOV87478.1 hypothetical protein BTA35_0205395 [Oceanospirillum linum]SEF89254.1 hypothetical protein SAMN04489856_10346 [Oleiphilus messinensis]SMP13639.1 hypothetical protein SAMN06264348_102494 [Oceanospirillum linum]
MFIPAVTSLVTFLLKRPSLATRGLLVLLVAIAGCSQPKIISNEAHSIRDIDRDATADQRLPLPLTRQAELKGVQVSHQDQHTCGFAALAAMIHDKSYFVQPSDLPGLDCYSSGQKGTSSVAVVNAGRGLGLLAYKLKPDLAHLLLQVEAGFPVLVLSHPMASSESRDYFSVLTGYNLDRQELTLSSEIAGTESIDMQTFATSWGRSGGWAYLFLEPGQTPVAAAPKDYLAASLDLADIGLSVSAQKALEQGIALWPESDAMRQALSNAYFQSGLLDSASDILLDSPSLSRSGELWNRIAYIQQARQCYSSAFQAVQCAVTLSPDDLSIQQSLQDILAKTDRPDGDTLCPQLTCPQLVEGF